MDRFPLDEGLSVDFTKESHRVTQTSFRGKFDVTAPRVIWYRRLGSVGLAPGLTPKFRKFSAAEADFAIEGILSILEPCKWFNEFWAARRASNKLLQYRLARDAGLTIPATLVSNEPAEARTWLSEHVDVVAKSLATPVLASDEETRTYAFTNLLRETDLTDLSDIAVTATQLQSAIEVAYEIRVTSVCGQHFAVRIDVPDSPHGTVRDWRSDMGTCDYTHFDMPDDLLARLDSLFADLGIDYGASDWIVTPDGEYVFLEVNPQGAWLWLEEKLPQLKISEEIARQLITAMKSAE